MTAISSGPARNEIRSQNATSGSSAAIARWRPISGPVNPLKHAGIFAVPDSGAKARDRAQTRGCVRIASGRCRRWASPAGALGRAGSKVDLEDRWLLRPGKGARVSSAVRRGRGVRTSAAVPHGRRRDSGAGRGLRLKGTNFPRGLRQGNGLGRGDGDRGLHHPAR